MPKIEGGNDRSKPDQRAVKIEVDYSGVSDRIYSNHVELLSTPLDMTLVFCEVEFPRDLPAPEGKQNVVKIKTKPRARIVLPRPVFESLAKLMAQSIEPVQSKTESD